MAATRPLRILKKLKPSSVSYVLVAWMFMLFVAITMVVYHTAEDNLAATEEAMGDDSLLDDVRAARLRAKSSRTHNSMLERRQRQHVAEDEVSPTDAKDGEGDLLSDGDGELDDAYDAGATWDADAGVGELKQEATPEPTTRKRRRDRAKDLPPGVRPVVDAHNLTHYEQLLMEATEEMLRGIRFKPINVTRVVVNKNANQFGEKMKRRGGFTDEDSGEIDKLLPDEDLKRDMHDHCAVVGNGGSMLSHKAGRIIDTKYDAVLRYNNAPTENFEAYVGRRTTYRAINNQWTRQYARQVAKGGARGRDSVGNTILLCFGNGSLRLYLRIRRDFPNRVAYYIAPELTAITRAQFKRIHVRMEGLGFGPYPGGHVMPSGIEGVLLMLQICKSVDVYGFDPPPPPPRPPSPPAPGYESPQQVRARESREAAEYARKHGEAYKYHYFDEVHGSSVHSFSFQFDFLHALHLTGLVTLCHGPPHVNSYLCPQLPSNDRDASFTEGLWNDK